MPRATTKTKRPKTKQPAKQHPIVEKLARLGRMIPEEELRNIPKDFSSQLDHYIYGWPKK